MSKKKKNRTFKKALEAIPYLMSTQDRYLEVLNRVSRNEAWLKGHEKTSKRKY